MTISALKSEMAKLSPTEKAELLDELIVMVGADDIALTPAQQIDLDRRIEEYRAGKVKLVPGDKAIEMIRNRKRA
jgi:putative addiction module component (TIGR02574 family)